MESDSGSGGPACLPACRRRLAAAGGNEICRPDQWSVSVFARLPQRRTLAAKAHACRKGTRPPQRRTLATKAHARRKLERSLGHRHDLSLQSSKSDPASAGPIQGAASAVQVTAIGQHRDDSDSSESLASDLCHSCNVGLRPAQRRRPGPARTPPGSEGSDRTLHKPDSDSPSGEWRAAGGGPPSLRRAARSRAGAMVATAPLPAQWRVAVTCNHDTEFSRAFWASSRARRTQTGTLTRAAVLSRCRSVRGYSCLPGEARAESCRRVSDPEPR